MPETYRDKVATLLWKKTPFTEWYVQTLLIAQECMMFEGVVKQISKIRKIQDEWTDKRQNITSARTLPLLLLYT